MSPIGVAPRTHAPPKPNETLKGLCARGNWTLDLSSCASGRETRPRRENTGRVAFVHKHGDRIDRHFFHNPGTVHLDRLRVIAILSAICPLRQPLITKLSASRSRAESNRRRSSKACVNLGAGGTAPIGPRLSTRCGRPLAYTEYSADRGDLRQLPPDLIEAGQVQPSHRAALVIVPPSGP